MNIELKIKYNEDLTISYKNDTIIGEIVIGNEIFSPENTPEFGVMIPYGNAKVFDKDDIILNKLLNNELLLFDNYDYLVSVSIFLDGNQLGVFDSTINYSFIERTITLSFTNSLEKWDEIPYNGFSFIDWRRTKFNKDENGVIIDETDEYLDRLNDYISGYELYLILLNETQKYEGIGSFNHNLELVSYLNQIHICCPNLEVNNLLEAWNYFCSLTFTCLYKDDNKIKLIRVC